LKRPVAIKCLRDELQRSERERKRFIEEAINVASLHHPNIIEIYDIIQTPAATFSVFELVNGGTLYDKLIESREGRIELPLALEYLRQIAGAIDHAHGRKVIHRDLKPSNIMIDEHGRIKVMDFGISRLVIATMATMTGTIVGTPLYMAPEQSLGRVHLTMDIYALGTMLYQMLTGHLPFSGGNLDAKLTRGGFIPASQHLPGLPRGVDAVIAKALDPEPDRRYQACADLVREFEAAIQQVTPPRA